MAKKKITQGNLADLENRKDLVLVESKEFDFTTYAINKAGKGMYLISGSHIIAIAAENVLKLLQEIEEVWAEYGTGGR